MILDSIHVIFYLLPLFFNRVFEHINGTNTDEKVPIKICDNKLFATISKQFNISKPKQQN